MMYALNRVVLLRGIAYILGFSHMLILNWIKEAGNDLPNIEVPDNVEKI